MKNNNMTTFIIVAGALILVVFSATLFINFLPNYESNSYYVKVDDEMNAKIEGLDIKDRTLTITTSGDAAYFCVKSTRTAPDVNNVCWKEIDNNTGSISIFKNTKYYVWIKDTSNHISNPTSTNSKDFK